MAKRVLTKEELARLTPDQLRKLDSDGRSIDIGTDDADSDRLGHTIVTWQRCTTLAHRDENPAAWKMGSLNITTPSGLDVSLVGLVADDLKALSDFLANCEQRLRDY